MTDNAIEIVKGEPYKVKRGRDVGLANVAADVVKAAKADPDEWYSAPIPDETNSGSIGTTVLSQIAKAVAEWSAKDGRIWIRFYE